MADLSWALRQKHQRPDDPYLQVKTRFMNVMSSTRRLAFFQLRVQRINESEATTLKQRLVDMEDICGQNASDALAC